MNSVAEAIISIHRCYADAILDGQKTVEFRRKIPALQSGTRLWIYATKPTGAVVGFTTVLEIDKGAPSTIWRRHRVDGGLNRSQFRAYFDDTEEAIAIRLSNPQRVIPISQKDLKRIRQEFHPPQVLTRLTALEAKALRKIWKRNAERTGTRRAEAS